MDHIVHATKYGLMGSRTCFKKEAMATKVGKYRHIDIRNAYRHRNISKNTKIQELQGKSKSRKPPKFKG